MTSKEAFRQNFGKEHADAVTALWFQEATKTAVLACAEKWANEDKPESGHFKTQGAFEFIREFRMLSMPENAPIRKDFDNLK